MVINKSKSSKNDSKTVTSDIVSSSSTSSAKGEDGKSVTMTTTTTHNLPVVEEKSLQKSTSSSMVTKSSSSTKVSHSSSSQEQKFFSTSSSMSSSSNATKSGRSQQLQSQSDAFLRGERTYGDIDARRSKNGSVLIESVDLHNAGSDFTTRSNLDNLVSIEIESKDSRAASSSTNELVTNTVLTGGDGNRNDVITVESGRKVKSGDTTTSTAVSDVKQSSSSHFQASSSATSSSAYQEFSTIDGQLVDSKATQSSAAKNLASSKTIKNGQVVDNKNVADSTTTFTSKVYDDKTKSWVVTGQSSVNETDIMLPASSTMQITSIDGASTSVNNKNNNSNSMTISSSAVDSQNTKVDSMSSSSQMMSSDMKMSTKATKEILEKNMSSKKESSRDEKVVTTSSNETVQVYDTKTKSWKDVDASSINKQKRPSYVRYTSQSDDGSWHTIYKRKLYDQFTKQWRIVDEKFVSNEDTTRHADIPEMIENSTNMTTTTYTTKVYDTKTGKWTIVEEKSFVDSEPVNVTQDIKRDFEKDEADLANIITTTETTKVINAAMCNKYMQERLMII